MQGLGSDSENPSDMARLRDGGSQISPFSVSADAAKRPDIQIGEQSAVIAVASCHRCGELSSPPLSAFQLGVRHAAGPAAAHSSFCKTSTDLLLAARSLEECPCTDSAPGRRASGYNIAPNAAHGRRGPLFSTKSPCNVYRRPAGARPCPSWRSVCRLPDAALVCRRPGAGLCFIYALNRRDAGPM